MKIIDTFREPDSCFLNKTTYLNHIKNTTLRKELIELKNIENNSFAKGFGLILNSIFTEFKATFWFSRNSYNTLATKYPKLNAAQMSGSKFAAFKATLIEKGYIKEVK